jgi:predicted kinase
VPTFIVVSGLPATGKTTVASELSRALSLPHFDKDAYLEALFADDGQPDPIVRKALSAKADEQFQRAAEAAHGAVLSSWWKHPASTRESGTPTAWLTARAKVFEVHCVSTPATAARRFLERTRHPAHCDDRWSYEGLLAMLQEQERLGPLFPSMSVFLNTEHSIELHEALSQVRAHLSPSNA